MNAIARLTSKKTTNDKKSERYCTIYESLENSFKEVKKHKEGTKHLDTWEEYLANKHRQ